MTIVAFLKRTGKRSSSLTCRFLFFVNETYVLTSLETADNMLLYFVLENSTQTDWSHIWFMSRGSNTNISKLIDFLVTKAAVSATNLIVN